MTEYEKKVKRIHPDMVVYSDSEEIAKRAQEDWNKHAHFYFEDINKAFKEWVAKTEKEGE